MPEFGKITCRNCTARISSACRKCPWCECDPQVDYLSIGTDLDLLLDAARAVITRRVRVISSANIQRRVRVGYRKAERLKLLLEQTGIIARTVPGWKCLIPPDGLDDALERIRETARA